MSDRFEIAFLGGIGLVSVLTIIVVIVVTVASVAGAVGFDQARGESTYTGNAVDLENEKGLLFQTTQIHMKTDARSSEHETFCVHPDNRDEQLGQLQDVVGSNQKVTLTYERPYFVPVWDCQSDTSIITDIEVHEDE